MTSETQQMVTNVTDSIAGTIKLVYDSLDRLTQENNNNGTVTYTYNDVGLRTNMTVTGETAVFYRYDAANRLTNVVQGTFTSSLAYDDSGRRTNLTLPNGVKVLYRYDSASRLTNLTYQAALTNRIDYSYDDAGNRVAQASLPVSFSTYNLPSAISISSYNAANQQLTFGTYTIQYDANGNVTNIVNSSTSSTNRLVWSARNQLTNMTGSVAATFQYDGLGRRVTRTVTGVTEKYLYDGLDTIIQKDAGGTVKVRYFRGLAIDEPWQRIDVASKAQNNTNRVYLADALGSVIALTDTAKAIATQYRYEPFGASTMTGGSTMNHFGFTAREDDGTGLMYYRARYYHPILSRFLSEDPIEYAGGDVNLYAYVGNEPLSYVDPLGLWDVIVEGFMGVGGRMRFGKNPDAKWYRGWFFGAEAGVGLGGGASFSPTATSPGFDCAKPYPYVYAGREAGFGVEVGPFSFGVTGTKGIKGYTEGSSLIERYKETPDFEGRIGGKVAVGVKFSGAVTAGFGFVDATGGR